MTQTAWILLEPPPPEWSKSVPDIPPLIAGLLWQRGVRSPAAAALFLKPQYDQLADPFLYRQMHLAVDRLILAVKKHEKITVYGDYDADGVTSTAIMVETLTALGANVNWYLPERLAEGYGLRTKVIDQLIEAGTKLLMTVDCGTTNVSEVTHAVSRGLEVIILDHHHQPPKLPPALAIINPAFNQETYPEKHQSSGGIAFTVSRALLRATKYGRQVDRTLPSGWEKWLLDLVAISTIADVMPLTGENRILVHFGLQVLKKTRRVGLRALLGLIGTAQQKIDETTVGYQIAPRINAAGRLHHAALALNLLLTADEIEALGLAKRLENINQDRQRLTEMAVAEAMEQINQQGPQAAYAAFAPHWSPGIIGLIAGRIVERVWRPVIVMTENGLEIVGSGRSIPGLDIMTAFETGQQYFSRYGGHSAAGGFTLVKTDRRVEFQQWWISHYQKIVGEKRLTKPIYLEAELILSEVTSEVLNLIDQCRPFGMGNERPKFILSAAVIESWQLVGVDKKHLRLTVSHNQTSVNLIGFRFGVRSDELRVKGRLDLALELSWNFWNGRSEPQFKIIDWRVKT